ncbi:MAG TPA: RHS repeat domain-containing protein [Xanthobacteraceae bacterium]|jgi:YD repeat-containing protein
MRIRSCHLKGLWLSAFGVLLTLPLTAQQAFADTYTYDARGRLYTVTLSNGAVTYYCYDAAGNRTYVGPVANC